MVGGAGLVAFEPVALEKRKLSAETCRKFGYGVGEYQGRPCQVATYYGPDRRPVGQKLRFPGKHFTTVGNMRAAPLFGAQLWPAGGKSITVTEGELDALSMSQAWDNRWPVVSIPSGAQGAKKCFEANIEFLNSFEKVVLMFDQDEAGRAAAVECAEVLEPGKAFIAELPLKDASDMLQAGRAEELVRAFWSAKAYRPDGVLAGDDVLEMILRPLPPSLPLPFAGLNAKIIGARRGECITICAGTGVGKSQTCREIGAAFVRMGEKVGYIALEESVQRSALGVMSVFADRPLHLNQADPSELRKLWEPIKDSLSFYDHWGTIDSAAIASKIRYMVHALGVGWVILDHVSIMVSGSDDDERRNLDKTCTRLGQLIRELNIGLFLVCHLSRPKGKPHEEGARTRLSQLRGSAGIGQLSDVVIGQERNTQDERFGNYSQYRVLKNRWVGLTGLAGTVEYDPETGRLRDSDFDLDGAGVISDAEDSEV